ncbi:response regulator [Micromonospora inositola]|uniref:Two component transcriptional regulator, LuxR family n=1 Tax=Micromonospora inositola TaxID=47865 RepID=A0A1C5J6H3_9ACTN|nr:response regulator transcription factor [Micromonospora inositola]SCG65769.1 two component transcriptional regulator, LuxR family [Micromonospora inositola]
MTIRVILVDDEHLIRSGLRMILTAEPDIDVVGEAADGVEAVEVARRTTPDVVLMDLRMPRWDGAEATYQILRSVTPPPAVLVLTTFHADREVRRAMTAGATGYLLKDAPEERIITAIRGAAQGATVLDLTVSRRLVDGLRTADAGPPPVQLGHLTPRELEVLQFLAQGMTNRLIAERLFLGEATVKTHVARVLSKLGLESRAEAVVLAYESGLVRPRTGDRPPAP